MKYDLLGATNETCPTRYLLSRLEGKWKTLILYHLLNGTQRPGELERRIGGVSRQVLTQQLKELEADGLVQKTVFAEVPPRVEYALSDFGRSLEPVLDQLYALGRHYVQHVRPRPGPDQPYCRKLAPTAEEVLSGPAAG